MKRRFVGLSSPLDQSCTHRGSSGARGDGASRARGAGACAFFRGATSLLVCVVRAHDKFSPRSLHAREVGGASVRAGDFGAPRKRSAAGEGAKRTRCGPGEHS